MQYRAAFFKTFFDNMVLPYVVPEKIDVQPGQWFVINTKFGEDLGLAESHIQQITADKFHVKKPPVDHNGDADTSGIEIDDAVAREIHPVTAGNRAVSKR